MAQPALRVGALFGRSREPHVTPASARSLTCHSTVSRSTALVGVGLALVAARPRRAAPRAHRVRRERSPRPSPRSSPIARARRRAPPRRPRGRRRATTGLYRLRDGARVATRDRARGWCARGADLAALNLAAPLVDGIQVLVPSRARGRRLAPESADADARARAAALGPRVSLVVGDARRARRAPRRGPDHRTEDPRLPRSSTGRSAPSTISTRFLGSARRASSNCASS